MKKWFLVLGAGLMVSVALASEVTFMFKSNKRVVDSITKNNKVLVEVGELSFALGVQHNTSGDNTTFYLGRKAKTTVPSVQSGERNWEYVDPYMVAKNLNYSIKLEKITDAKTKVQSEVLVVNYTQKITCDDFIFWQDAQKFFNASSNLIATDFEQRDPYNIDKSKDGLACEFLPRAK